MSFTKEFLSGSANGIPVAVAATATPGTTIHTAHATAKDEIVLFATNVDTVDRVLTIEFGGVLTVNQIKITVQTKDTVQVICGVALSGSLVMKAFADAANVINVFGYVNRISS